MKKLQIIPMAIAASLMMFTACKKEEYQTESDTEPQEFQVNMTDNPGEYEALTVEIESVEAYNDQSGWVTLNSQSQVVSVLDLTNGKEATIASMQNAEIAAYSKIKLNFGNEHKLTLKSSTEIGGLSTTTTAVFQLGFEGPKSIEIEINEQISASEGADVLIDFDVAQSIKEDGDEYVIQPALKLIEDRATGVDGKVKGTASAALLLTNGNDTISAYTNAEGEFLLRGMEEGTYDLIVYPAQEEGEEMMEEQIIEGVVVVEGKIKSAGTIRF
ncbi:MAG: DUF4382 domain-containing protein [Crocinitomicaceae bacterium]